MFCPSLRTDRLVLRPLRISDAPAVQLHFGNWEVIQHLSLQVPWPYTDGCALQFLRKRLPQAAQGDAILWAITLAGGNDECIGVISYMRQDDGGGNRAFWLGTPWWGRGYMTEAVCAVQDYLFFDLGLEKIRVANSVNNSASRRIKEKTAARFLGRTEFTFHDGSKQMELWEISREDWQHFRSEVPDRDPV